MNYELESKVRKNSFYIGLTIVIFLLIYFLFFINFLLSELDKEMKIVLSVGSTLFHFLIMTGLFVALRRYLRKVTFNFENKTLEIVSIIKSLRKRISFHEIQYIKLLKSAGLKNWTNGFRNHNLVIKIKSSFQPQIFEISNETDFEIAKELLEKHNTTANSKS